MEKQMSHGFVLFMSRAVETRDPWDVDTAFETEACLEACEACAMLGHTC